MASTYQFNNISLYFYLKIGNLCESLECNHDASSSELVIQSLCRLEIDNKYSGNGVLISRDKVLTIAFILYESQKRTAKPVAAERMKISLPYRAGISADNEYNVDRPIIPHMYKHPSYQANLAILIVSYF